MAFRARTDVQTAVSSVPEALHAPASPLSGEQLQTLQQLTAGISDAALAVLEPGSAQERGGLRGVHHYMQRTAVQGSPETITRITNEWIAGANQPTDRIHPFRKSFEELEIGDTHITHRRTVTETDSVNFAGLSGDFFYAHMDDIAAKESLFGRRVAHGYFVIAAAAHGVGVIVIGHAAVPQQHAVVAGVAHHQQVAAHPHAARRVHRRRCRRRVGQHETERARTTQPARAGGGEVGSGHERHRVNGPCDRTTATTAG